MIKVYKIDDFFLKTEVKKEIFEEKTTLPIKLSYQKTKVEEYELLNQFRRYTAFKSLSYRESDSEHYQVIDDLLDMIELVEMLKSFNGNKLNVHKAYTNPKFSAKVVIQEKEEPYLSIIFTNFDRSLNLDKFECAALAAKFSKILQKCEIEPWQEQDR